MSRWDSSSDDEAAKEQKRAKKRARQEEKTKQTAMIAPNTSTSTSPSSSYSNVHADANVNKSDIDNSAADTTVEDRKSVNVDDGDGSQRDEKYNPLFHGCRSVDSYQRLNFIDQGTYGMVFKAKCRETGECFALKQVKLDGTTNISKYGFPISALRETNILLALSHPNIVKVKEMVVGSTLDKVFMVMELGDADLRTCIEMSKQPFSTAEIKCLMKQFLSAVKHMHDNWFIHRDLKTSNLLYSNEGVISVCDFGMARKYGSPLQCYSQRVVSLWYRPPELLLAWDVPDATQHCKYSTSLDMWAVGCIFAEMLLRKPLLPGQGELDQITQIFKLLGAPNDEKWPGFSSLPHARKVGWKVPSRSKLREVLPATSFSGGATISDLGFDLLSRLLIYDPTQRISAIDAFNHPWFDESPIQTDSWNMPKFDFSSSK